MTLRAKNMIRRNTGAAQMAEPTLSPGFAKSLLDFTVSQGTDEANLLWPSGLRAGDIADQDDPIAVSRSAALMHAGKEATGNSALALEFGAASDFR
ncbi:MAG: hypothetical protein WEA77_09095 [Hyphomonas sp.]|uniref:hypothetical protein n=1 Tax=Hyphomonas sp. TaxID=87 RepID=UPI0034A00B6C